MTYWTYYVFHNADRACTSHGAKRSIVHPRFPSTSAGEYSSLTKEKFWLHFNHDHKSTYFFGLKESDSNKGGKNRVEK